MVFSVLLVATALHLAPGGALLLFQRVTKHPRSQEVVTRVRESTSSIQNTRKRTGIEEEEKHPIAFSSNMPESEVNARNTEEDEHNKTTLAAMQRAKQWAAMDPNPITAQLATTNECFHLAGSQNRLKFGTAGLRGPMGVGPMRMNDLVVIQTAQGLAKYFFESSKCQAVVIGYDHRASETLQISSRTLAMWTALVFRKYCTVILLDGFVATPIVPFVQQQLEEDAIGIMVTASHNPKEDAGYKIYGLDACQIRSPMDEAIASSIQENLEPWHDYQQMMRELKANATNDASCYGLSDPEMTEKMKDQYFAALTSCHLLQTHPEHNTEQATRITYTAMNGVGYKFIRRAFQEFGLEVPMSVPEQQNPDPSFSGTPLPNPEEKGALAAAMRYAEANDCSIILANDPDADRLAVAERIDSSWYIFSGDEIGCLLGSELYQRSQHSSSASSIVPVMCASTVSSKFLKAFAKAEGFHFEETQPGFKWIGAAAKQLNRQLIPGSNKIYQHLFSYEESIGYCCGDVVFDKDGISAAIVVAQMANHAYGQNMTLFDRLKQLYQKYGEFVSLNGYFRVSDMEKVPALLNKLSMVKTIENYPVTTNTCVRKSEERPPTQVVLNFENGCVAQFRASGTEPKFKYYFELPGKPGTPREKVVKELTEMMNSILEPLCDPEKYGLARP